MHLVIYNLMRRVDIAKDRDHKYFRWKEDLCDFVEDYWEYLAPEKASECHLVVSNNVTGGWWFISGRADRVCNTQSY